MPELFYGDNPKILMSKSASRLAVSKNPLYTLRRSASVLPLVLVKLAKEEVL